MSDTEPDATEAPVEAEEIGTGANAICIDIPADERVATPTPR